MAQKNPKVIPEVTLQVPEETYQHDQKSKSRRLSIAGFKVRKSWLSTAHHSLFQSSSDRWTCSMSRGK